MNHLTTISLLVVSLCIGQSLAAICYLCSSKININNVEIPWNGVDNCASISSSTPVSANSSYCITTFSTAEGVTTITRSAMNQGRIPDFPICTGDTCICNTDKCNSETAKPPSSLECYECGSSDYFSNGCGEKLDTSSQHVRKVSGCSACGKSKSFSNYVVRYTRDCIRGMEVEEGCIGEDEFLEGCACKTSLCNGASNLHFAAFSLAAAFALSVAAKIF